MNVIQTCVEFDQRWNERLDQREDQADDRDPALADHAASCELCRSRELVFGDFEALTIGAWSRVAVPAPEAILRWQAAAAAGLKSRPLRLSHRRSLRIATRWATILGVAASILLVAQVLLLALWPAEAAPVVAQQATALSPLFEEAFTEASTRTWELAREISAPADRLSSQALGATSKPPLPPFQPTQYHPLEASVAVAPITSAASSQPEMDLISGSSRHTFRLLGGRDEEVEDSEVVESY